MTVCSSRCHCWRWRVRHRPGERIVSPQIAREVLRVLHAVTGDEGTARKARVPGYQVGGKTGTVHKVGPRGYIADQYVALFAGIAPIDDPRIVTVVVINDPKGAAYGGGAVAAPVFSTVTQGALRLLNVPPTDTAALAAAAAAAAAIAGPGMMMAAGAVSRPGDAPGGVAGPARLCRR